VRIRTLEEGDRDLLFGPRLGWAADEWLARQRRDEIHVAVAELEGVPTALMRHLEDVARDRGCSTVELLVAQDNDSALRLYGRLGYEICGQGVNRWVEKEGSVVEEFEELCWRMRKRLLDE